MHVIAAKAVALREALRPGFKHYASAVVANAKVLAATLAEAGFEIVSGGTDSHLMLVDLRSMGITGRDAEKSLERVGITCNKNGIPFDPEKPTVTSGIRLGSPAATTRGFGPDEFHTVGRCIVATLRALAAQAPDDGAAEACVRTEVRELCARFPIYPDLGEDWGRKK
jgi:glycine hydroxymethyltransferase